MIIVLKIVLTALMVHHVAPVSQDSSSIVEKCAENVQLNVQAVIPRISLNVPHVQRDYNCSMETVYLALLTVSVAVVGCVQSVLRVIMSILMESVFWIVNYPV